MRQGAAGHRPQRIGSPADGSGRSGSPCATADCRAATAFAEQPERVHKKNRACFLLGRPATKPLAASLRDYENPGKLSEPASGQAADELWLCPHHGIYRRDLVSHAGSVEM